MNHILLLGGTAEGYALAARLAAELPALRCTTSLAGRTRAPRQPAGAVRVGGFGGADGLAAWLRAQAVDLLIDATHPFARRISANAVLASVRTGVPLLRLMRPPWQALGQAEQGDNWLRVRGEAEAAFAVPRGARVFLALGSQRLAPFAARTFADREAGQSVAERSGIEARHSAIDTGQGAVEVKEGVIKTGQSVVEAGQSGIKAGRGAVEAKEGVIKTGQSVVEAGQGAIKTGQGVVEAKEDMIKTGQSGIDAGRSGIKAGRGAVEAKEGVIKTGQSVVEAGQEATKFFLRLAEEPDPPLKKWLASWCEEIIVSRGPFDLESERQLFARLSITHLIARNSGGTASAKLSLSLPTYLIPPPPEPTHTQFSEEEVLKWVRNL